MRAALALILFVGGANSAGAKSAGAKPKPTVTPVVGMVSLTRPGTFTLKITVTGRVSKATDTFECPLTVLPLPR